MQPLRALDELVARAGADPAVRGLVPIGSHARGMATVHSDVDVVVVVDRREGQWPHTRRAPAEELDLLR